MFSKLKSLYRKTDINNSEVLTVALIGGGLRGMVYTDIMKDCPQKFKSLPLQSPMKAVAESFRKPIKFPTICALVHGQIFFQKRSLPILL